MFLNLVDLIYLRTGPTPIKGWVTVWVARYPLVARLCPTCIQLTKSTVTLLRQHQMKIVSLCTCVYLVTWGTRPTLCAIHCVPAVDPRRALEAGVRYVCALWLLDLARLAILQRFPQQHRLLPLCLHLLLQPSQCLNKLLQCGNQQPETDVRFVR